MAERGFSKYVMDNIVTILSDTLKTHFESGLNNEKHIKISPHEGNCRAG